MQVQHVKELQCYCIQRALPTIVTSRVVTEIKVQSNNYALLRVANKFMVTAGTVAEIRKI